MLCQGDKTWKPEGGCPPDWDCSAAGVYEEGTAVTNRETSEPNLKVPSPHFERPNADAANEVNTTVGDQGEANPGQCGRQGIRMGSVDRQKRMAEAVRLIITRRERAPRSPRMERALKRLIWRYSQTRPPVSWNRQAVITRPRRGNVEE